jgi:GMP synthase (glutamine-hydrolysing)
MKIQIIMGSSSDMPVAEKAKTIFEEFGIIYDVKVASAHRTPDLLKTIVEKSDADLFIGIAGLSAALPGTIAAHTIKPVIGVPVSGKVNLDAILSIIQMPPGIPVGAVGLDRGENAALLAVEILAVRDIKLTKKLQNYQKDAGEGIVKIEAFRMFNAEKFIEKTISTLQKEIKGKALIAFSGGVDSTVCAALVNKAIGEQLIAVHVDTGYMRKNEPEQVKHMMEDLSLNYRFVAASKEYYLALKGVEEPEKKRKIIGEKFIRIFEKVAREEKIDYLVQGTIAPDWIESGGGLRDTIKSHHNVGGLPHDMKLRLVEPLRDLYKDEVRKVARSLQLQVSERQPFPGPGLAIRIIGEATPERTELVREACDIVEKEIERASEKNLMERPWQYFAVLIPIKTVGVHGDKRAYGNTIAIRAVQSIDAMTCHYSTIPHDVLDAISTKITNTLKENVTRIVYDVTNKPPGTVEWE